MRNRKLSVTSCALKFGQIFQQAIRYRCRATSFLAIGAVLAVTSSNRCYAEDPSIYLIEEDWEMAINEPDAVNHCPQVSFFMSPCEAEQSYFQLQLNYAADESFSGGGFHVAAVKGGHMHDEERSLTKTALSTAHDHVRWTSVMALIDDKYYYAVKNGQCKDWGQFGGPNYLVEMHAGGHGLEHYHPQRSLDNVDVGFGGNRVASITLKRVRVHYTNGTSKSMPVNRQP